MAEPVYIARMDPLAPLIANLNTDGRLRVWSLVITVFGDLVQHRGGVISTARLGRVLGRLGVEPGALRTALSRLDRDGWIARTREGRQSLCRLSESGLDRFAPATSAIYAPPRARPVSRWALAIGPDGAPMLGPHDAVPPDAACVVTGDLTRLTDGFRRTLLSPAHRAALVALNADLAALEATDPAPLEAAAARVLLIHRWRRIVLRHPDLAPELMPGDTPLADPRRAVARAYARLAPAAEAWLDGGDDGLAPMPGATAAFAGRFRALDA